MPNGPDKFWVRTASAIWRFRERYGKWPTRLLISGPESWLEGTYGGPENVALIEARMEIVTDVPLSNYAMLAVVDEEGHCVEYPGCMLGYDAEVERWIPVRFHGWL
ncbi:MAG: hypothetical protein ACE5JG_05130 [Planctomycetota bacterium]